MKAKRMRSKNFSEKEKKTALELIESFRSIVENKATDGATLSIKKQAWEKISEEFNKVYVNEKRDVKQLKIFWGNMKRTGKTVGENKDTKPTEVEVEEVTKEEIHLHNQTEEDPLYSKDFHATQEITPSLKNKRNKKKFTMLRLERVYYLQKIKLTNMELRYKRQLYELEVKLKENELKKMI